MQAFRRVGGNKAFFHPHHAVPAAELMSTVREFPHRAIAHVFVEADAGMVEVFVWLMGKSDAGIGAEDVLGAQSGFKLSVEAASHADPAGFFAHVDGDFGAPVVGSAGMEARGVGIAQHLPTAFGHKPRERGLHTCEPSAKFFFGRHGVFKTYGDGFILTVRSTPYTKRRIGLIASLDLEKYDYRKGEKPLIRATEGTVEERIPPRLKIRKNADIELTHIMVLYNDETRSINEKLYANKDSFEKIYDFTLNMNGGKIEGYFIKDTESIIKAFAEQLNEETLVKKYGEKTPFLFAVGDGNHSLATAKAHWNAVKENLSEEERAIHPARFALCEIVNVYDEGIEFLPIHRFVKGVDAEKLKEELLKVEGNFTVYANECEYSVKADCSVPATITKSNQSF